MNSKKRFREIFRFRGDIRSQSSKIRCPRSQRVLGHLNFSLDTEILNTGYTLFSVKSMCGSGSELLIQIRIRINGRYSNFQYKVKNALNIKCLTK